MNRDDLDPNVPINIIWLDGRLPAEAQEARLTPPAVESEERRTQRQLKADYATRFAQFLAILSDVELRDRAEGILGLLPSDHKDRREAVTQLFNHWKSDFHRRLWEKQNKS